MVVGLDPIVTRHISKVLHRLAEANAPRIVLSLRPQDEIPEWVTHLVYAGEDGKVEKMGLKEEVLGHSQMYRQAESIGHSTRSSVNTETGGTGRLPSGRENSTRSSNGATLSRDGHQDTDDSVPDIGEAIVEMQGVRIAYGQNSVLGDWQQDVDGSSQSGLHWNVHRNQRWGIL